jgi:cell division septation protein DedD
VQVGAFRSPEAARRFAALLAEEEPASSRFVVESWAADVLLTRVRVGPFPDRWEAAAAAREMEARGHKPFIAAERE